MELTKKYLLRLNRHYGEGWELLAAHYSGQSEDELAIYVAQQLTRAFKQSSTVTGAFEKLDDWLHRAICDLGAVQEEIQNILDEIEGGSIRNGPRLVS